MKWIICSDIHLRDWTDNERDDQGLSRKTSDIIKNFEYICNYAMEKNILNVAILGDINDTRGVLHAHSFIKFSRILNAFDKIHFYILSGNHDVVPGLKDMSAINIFEGLKNVTCILDTYTTENILWVPHKPDLLDEIKKSSIKYKKRILFSHFPLYGAKTGNKDLLIKSNIKPDDLSYFKTVIIGDIHKPQEIINNKTKIIYPGSIIQLNRGEAGDKKRFLSFDDSSMEIESIDLSCREYVIIEIKDKSDNKKLIKQIKENQKLGNIVIIKNYLKEMPNEFKKLNEVKIIDSYMEDFQQRGITSGMTIEDQMLKYLDISNIEENKENYMKVGLEIIKSKSNGIILNE